MFPTRAMIPAAMIACFCLFLSPGSVLAGDAKVTRQITLKGLPVASGRITFHLKDGQFVGAKFQNGTYKVDRVPEGTWKVTIEGAGVPDKYASEEKTALKVEVKEGDAEFNFNLQ